MERTEVRLPLTGGCFCGACRYELTAPPLAVWACHCTDCQRQTGSAFNMTMPAPRPAFRFTAGDPAAFERVTASGRTTVIRFCGACGARLIAESNPETVVIRPGTLDDATWVRPVTQHFMRSAHPWAHIDGAKPYEEAAPFSEIAVLWAEQRPRFT